MKKVLITGGSRGIGRACVEKFTEEGYQVFFSYNSNRDAAMEVMEKTKAKALQCDISDMVSVKKVRNEIGEVDILINNAGISQIKMFQDITETDWDKMFNINTKGVFMVTQEFIQPMINKKWGRIINISSMWGEVGASCEVHYSASKAAIIGLTKALSKEVAPSGVNVNAISPGVIETDMNSHLTDEERAEIISEIPLGYIAKPKEIADVCLFLAGDTGGYITGQNISVSGGIVI